MPEEEKAALNKRRFIEELKREGIIEPGKFMLENGIKLNYKVDFGSSCGWPTCSMLGEELGKLISNLLPDLENAKDDFCDLAIIETATRIHSYSILSYLFTGTPPGVNVFQLDQLEEDTLFIGKHNQVVLFEDVLSTGSNLRDLVDEIEPFIAKISKIIVGFDHQIGGVDEMRQVFPNKEIEVIISIKDMELPQVP